MIPPFTARHPAYINSSAGSPSRASNEPPRDPGEYKAHWAEWASSATPGGGEEREMALEKMIDCLNKGYRILDLADLNLRDLPDYLPPQADHLNISGNNLTSLCKLPTGLIELNASKNHLYDLPVHILEELEWMDVSDNDITSLPVFSDRLLNINLSNNELTGLPTSIMQLSNGVRINIEQNPLSDATLRQLNALNTQPDYHGPRFEFSMERSDNVPPRLLNESIADWQTGAEADKWTTFECEPNAAAFSAFLTRLAETESAKKSTTFKDQVASWLAHLADSPDLRSASFDVAMDASTHCEDRVTLAWNMMQKEAVVADVNNGRYDNHLQDLIAQGRKMFRLVQLEQIAANKIKTMYFFDEVEVYLGFQTRLREPLELTNTAEGMRFFDVSDITKEDLQAAEKTVKNAENSRFSAWLAQWTPWQNVIKRTAPEIWEQTMTERAQLYEDTYENQLKAALAAKGLSGNDDAEVTLGRTIMEGIDSMVFEAQSESVLASKGLSQHLSAYWK